MRVRERMSAAPIKASPDLSIDEAARLMLDGGFHHLPVVGEDDRPVGVVGLRAVVGLRHRFPGW